MFLGLATLFTFSARQTVSAVALPISPMQVRAKRTDNPRRRKSSLACMWHADRATGRLEFRWMALQPSKNLTFDAGLSLDDRSFSAGRCVLSEQNSHRLSF